MTEQEKSENIEIRCDMVKDLAGAQDSLTLEKFVRDLYHSLFIFEGTSNEDFIKKINPCLSIIQNIKPQDQLETILVIQMVAAHNTTMECLRRANIPNQTFAGRATTLTQANKFMRLYIDQLNALNKHRGKGQQNLIVGQVNVESGGQAIVGTVSKEDQKKEYAPGSAAIADNPASIIDMPSPPIKEKILRKKNKK